MTKINQLIHTHLNLLMEASQTRESIPPVNYGEEQEKIQNRFKIAWDNLIDEIQKSFIKGEPKKYLDKRVDELYNNASL